MIPLCLSFCVSLLTGFSLASIILAWQRKSYIHLLLQLCLAVGLGFGISSSLYFIHLFYGPSTVKLAVMETGLLISLFPLFLYLSSTLTNRISFDSAEKPVITSVYRRILLAGFSCTLVSAFITFLLRSLILPHGGWDAWQTWNLFARFLYRGGDRWREGFSTLLNPHHPDYPLLIPAAIARCWQYIGHETQVVPVITAGLFTFATIGLLFSSLSVLKDKNQALLAGIILAGTPNFIILGSMQYADVPLSFFFLAALVLCSLQDRMPENPNFSLLAGIMAGFSCWTKNEGFLFLLSMILAQVVIINVVNTRKRYMRLLALFISGAAPIMALILFFKWNIVPANDLISGQKFNTTLSKLTNLPRYLLIMKSFLLTTLYIIPIVPLLAFYVVYYKIDSRNNDKRILLLLPLTLFSMFVGYFFVYLITPYDLKWHLDTSFSRLLMQLWPSVIFTFFLLARTSEEALAESRNIR